MISQLPSAESQSFRSAHYEPVAWRPRFIDPAVPYRAKDEFDSIPPLPKWTSTALVWWAVAAATAYTAVLAHWWE